MKRASMNVKPENRTNSNIPADQSLFNCVEEEIINIKHLDEDTEIYNDDEGIPVGVKQENPTKSAEIEDFESSTCDYWYQCHLCFEKKMDFISLVDHIKSTHTTEITIKSIKYPYLEPDIHDSDNYCRSCEKTYVSRALYRTHLRQSHRMYLKPLQAVPTANVPGSINSSFYCSSCERTYTDRRRYRIHMRSTHRIEPIPLPPKQNPDIIPDWNNPDSYCSSCDTTYKSKRSFRKHCRILHNLKSPSKNPSNESPDPLDPNFYCKPCNTTYKSRRSLREHCRKVHGIRFEKPFANPDILPNVSDPNNFCITCNKTLKNNFRFLQHLRIVHKMMDLPQSSDNNEIDINDPNFYCSACEKTLSTKYIFQKHLMSIHFIQIPPAEKKRTEAVVPDADDPNNYCRACEKKYKSKSVYRTHLRYSHKMVLEASVRPTRYVPNCFPDPLDRSLHCPVCNITNKSFSSYRQHCKLVHRVKLEPYNRSIVNPDAIIDIQSPDFYCAQCDKRLATKQRFARHLKCVHKLVYPPTIKKLGTRRNKAL